MLSMLKSSKNQHSSTQVRQVLPVGAVVAVMGLLCANPAAAVSISRVTESSFTSDAGLITFSEFALNTSNPTYNPSDYGGGAGAPTVSFGGFFTGQSLGDAGSCPAGAALTGCVIGTPTGSLALDLSSPATFISDDLANPTSPILSGSPKFNGPISVLFDVDLAGVGLEGGFFNAIGGTAITAFDRSGAVLGSVANESTGIEFLGLVINDGSNQIAGLQFSLVGAEPFGFAIDNLRFGQQGEVITPVESVPEPSTIIATLMAGGIGTMLNKKKKKKAKAANA